MGCLGEGERVCWDGAFDCETIERLSLRRLIHDTAPPSMSIAGW